MILQESYGILGSSNNEYFCKQPLNMSHKLLICAILACILAACSQFTYTPKSKRQQQLAKPSIAVITSIANFREQFGTWPTSLYEMQQRDIKYRDAFKGFPYLYTNFKIRDMDNMVFSFSQHTNDDYNFRQSGVTDLNSYQGEVRFTRKNGKIIWKIRML